LAVLKLIYYDDQTNPAVVPGIYAKLLDIDKVDLVIGPYGTTCWRRRFRSACNERRSSSVCLGSR
jgi:hypothetical protein